MYKDLEKIDNEDDAITPEEFESVFSKEAALKASRNEFWKVVKNPTGPKHRYTPKQLWEKAVEYFTWVQNNPLYELKIVGALATEKAVPKMRAMTEAAFCLYAGIDSEVFRKMKVGENGKVCPAIWQKCAQSIAAVIYAQKFEGAAADFLNANIISRDLGLADKKQIEGNIFNSDTPIEFS